MLLILSCRFPLDDVRYDVACPAFAVSEEVTVCGQRGLWGAMSYHSCYGGRVNACLDLKRYEQMPECMHSVERKSSAFTFSHQPRVRSVWMHRLAVPFGEQPVVLVPLAAQLCLVAVLIVLVCFEQFDHCRRQVYKPCVFSTLSSLIYVTPRLFLVFILGQVCCSIFLRIMQLLRTHIFAFYGGR